MTYRVLYDKFIMPLQEAMNLPGRKFSYAVEKNLNKALSVYNKAKKPLDQNLPATGKQISAYYDDRDKSFRAFIESQGKDYQPKKEDLEPVEEKVKKRHKEAVAAIEEYEKRLLEMHSLPVTEKINWHTVNEENLSELITGNIRRSLLFMISSGPEIEVVKPG